MRSPAAIFVVAALLVVDVVVGLVHLELKSSTEAHTPGVSRRESGVSDILHHPDTPWYYIDVYIGTPPQKIKLRLEDRPATWLPWLESIEDVKNCQEHYNSQLCEFASISGIYDPTRSSSFVNITGGPDLFVDYTASEAASVKEAQTHGKFGADSLQMNQLVVTNLTIGLAHEFATSPALGVGMPDKPEEYPYVTFLETLQRQGRIKSLVYSVYLNDLYSNGDIYFGAVDQSRFYGDLIPFDNSDNLVGHIPITGLWWIANNGSIESLVRENRDDSTYVSDGNVSFGSTNLGLPQTVYDQVVDKFNVLDRDGRWWLKCDAPIDVGELNFAIGGVLYNITSRQLVSNEIGEGDDCHRYLTIEVVPDARESTPGYRLGDPFLRGTYAVFDYTNKQTLLAPAVINATVSQIIEVGQGGANVQATGQDIPASLKDIPSPDDDIYRSAPGAPTQPASDPTQSKAIIVGGLLGGIAVLILVLGAVYAIRPRSQRSRDIASWFTFVKPRSRKPSADPVIAYPTRHDSKYYTSGGNRSRITPVSYPPTGESTSPAEMENGHANGEPRSPERSYYASTALAKNRLSNVAEGSEGMEMAHTPFQQANRYGYNR